MRISLHSCGMIDEYAPRGFRPLVPDPRMSCRFQARPGRRAGHVLPQSLVALYLENDIFITPSSKLLRDFTTNFRDLPHLNDLYIETHEGYSAGPHQQVVEHDWQKWHDELGRRGLRVHSFEPEVPSKWNRRYDCGTVHWDASFERRIRLLHPVHGDDDDDAVMARMARGLSLLDVAA